MKFLLQPDVDDLQHQQISGFYNRLFLRQKSLTDSALLWKGFCGSTGMVPIGGGWILEITETQLQGILAAHEGRIISDPRYFLLYWTP